MLRPHASQPPEPTDGSDLGGLLRRILSEAQALGVTGTRTTKPYAQSIADLAERAIGLDDAQRLSASCVPDQDSERPAERERL